MEKELMKKQQGVGVQSSSSVSAKQHKVGGHGDMKMSDTKAAFNAACNDSKKG